MKIEHVAIWAKDLDVMKDFYAGNFGASVGGLHTEESGFQSYFLTFPSGSRLEIMSRQDVRALPAFDGVERPDLAVRFRWIRPDAGYTLAPAPETSHT